MRSLYLRIYATLVVVLLLFAAASGWVFERHLVHERVRAETVLTDRMSAWAELIQHSLPGDEAPEADQAAALRDWSARLRLPLALDNATGARIAQSESFVRFQAAGMARGLAVRLDDGRTLWILRPGQRSGQRSGQRPGGGAGQRPSGPDASRESPPGSATESPMESPGGAPPGPRPGARTSGPDGMLPFLPFVPFELQRGLGLVVVLVLLFVAVAVGAFPVVRRLTRRLEALKLGVEQFGAGQLQHRVEVSGQDEVAAVATSFNVAAERIEALVRSHQSLLANASHELRSPLARMKMAVAMLEEAPPAQRDRLKREIDTNVAELDALVEEVLLASRLDAAPDADRREPVELLGMAAEEAARVDARVSGSAVSVLGEERLLRRALRNLLENARRYGGGEVELRVEPAGDGVEVHVCDQGPGVPAAMRERIFEPFFRLPGHAELAGGVGLGLSLVKQIAARHGGGVRCEGRDGGGSCFVLTLPRGG